MDRPYKVKHTYLQLIYQSQHSDKPFRLQEMIPYRALISGEAGAVERACGGARLVGEGHHIEDAQTRLGRT